MKLHRLSTLRTIPLMAASTLLLLGSTAQAAIFTGSATLTGDQEVGPVVTDAFGEVDFVVDSTAGTIDIQATITGIFLADITFPSAPLAFGAAGPFHIHEAPAGTNGGIVVPFPSASFFTETATGLSIVANGVGFDPGLVSALLNEGLYFNLHTLDHSGGEIRGQIIEVVPEPSTALLIAIGLGALASRRRA